MQMLSTRFLSISLKAYQMEKCSESTGINFVLFFFKFLFIKFQPQIIASLLAIAIVLLYLIISIVGLRP